MSGQYQSWNLSDASVDAGKSRRRHGAKAGMRYLFAKRASELPAASIRFMEPRPTGKTVEAKSPGRRRSAAANWRSWPQMNHPG